MIRLRAPLALLHVTDDGATLDLPEAPALTVKGHKGAAVTSVLTALADKPHLPVLILADTTAQDYKNDDLPPVSLFDKKRLARRRLHHHFPQKDLTRLDLMGPRQVLFTALPTTSAAAKWRAALAKIQHPLWGIVPAPLEGIRLAGRLAPASRHGWAMTIVQLTNGGFRQIVTCDGLLRMTRLASAPPETSPEMLAATLALDIEAARAYLARFGLHSETPMTGLVICDQAHHAALHAAGLDLSTLCLFSPSQAATALHLPLASTIETLFAAWLRRPFLWPRLLQTLPEKKCARHFLARDAGRWAAFGLLVFSLSLGAFEAFSIHTAQSHLAAAHHEADQTAHAYQDARAKDGALTKPLGRLRLAATHARLFSVPASFSPELWDNLGQALGSDARLSSLAWQAPTAQKPETLSLEARRAETDTADTTDPLLEPPPLDANDLDRIPSVSLPPLSAAIPAPGQETASLFTTLQDRFDKALAPFRRVQTQLPSGTDQGALSSRAPTAPTVQTARFTYEKTRQKGTP